MASLEKSRGSEPVNLILEGTRLEGDMNFASQLVVAGHVKGNLVCESILFIERGGRVEGRIEAPAIVVHGNLDGTVLATTSLEICSGATVGGDVAARSVRVDQGAILTANLTISSNLPDRLAAMAPAAAAPARPAPEPRPEARPETRPGPRPEAPAQANPAGTTSAPPSFLSRPPGLNPR